MALKVIKTEGGEKMSNQPKADRRLYYTADRSALVEEGDPRGAYLACAAGDPIPAGFRDPASPPPKAEKPTKTESAAEAVEVEGEAGAGGAEKPPAEKAKKQSRNKAKKQPRKNKGEK